MSIYHDSLILRGICLVMLLFYCENIFATKEENIKGKDFNVTIKPFDNPVYQVDSELMHMLKRREREKIIVSLRKKYGSDDSSLSSRYLLTHKEVWVNGAKFGILLTHMLDADRKNYQILGVNKQLIAVHCYGKHKSYSNALGTSCAKATKRVFKLDKQGLMKLLKEDPDRVGSPLDSTSATSAGGGKVINPITNNPLKDPFKNLATPEKQGVNSSEQLQNSQANTVFNKNKNKKTDICRSTTKWMSINVRGDRVTDFRGASHLDNAINNPVVRLYCQKANKTVCNKQKSWLNYEEYLHNLFGSELANKEIESTMQQQSFLNGKRSEKLCLTFKNQ